jgi:hypothetical protein
VESWGWPMPDSDDAPIQESKSKLSKISEYLNHPIMITLVTFLLSGIVATGFAKWLETRGALLASSIRRKLSEQDFTEREREYDKIYVKYNSVLQSQIFRFNEFLNSQYAVFDINNDEISLKLPSRLLH